MLGFFFIMGIIVGVFFCAWYVGLCAFRWLKGFRKQLRGGGG